MNTVTTHSYRHLLFLALCIAWITPVYAQEASEPNQAIGISPGVVEVTVPMDSQTTQATTLSRSFTGVSSSFTVQSDHTMIQPVMNSVAIPVDAQEHIVQFVIDTTTVTPGTYETRLTYTLQSAAPQPGNVNRVQYALSQKVIVHVTPRSHISVWWIGVIGVVLFSMVYIFLRNGAITWPVMKRR